MVNEKKTSKVCCRCGSPLMHMTDPNKEIYSIRIVQCLNRECRYIFNKDSNACTNILNRAIRTLKRKYSIKN